MATQKTYIVTYDLNQLGQNYDCIREKLGAFGTQWNIQGSVWIIRTDISAIEIATVLQKCLDGNDTLLVFELNGENAWVGFDQKGDNWLEAVLV